MAGMAGERHNPLDQGMRGASRRPRSPPCHRAVLIRHRGDVFPAEVTRCLPLFLLCHLCATTFSSGVSVLDLDVDVDVDMDMDMDMDMDVAVDLCVDVG